MLTNATTNGDGPDVEVGNYNPTLRIWGTWDGAYVMIYDITNSSRVPIAHAFTEDKEQPTYAPQGAILRAVVSNAGGSTDLNATID